MHRQRFLYSLYRHTHWVRCAKGPSLLFHFQKVVNCLHQEVQMHRSYYGGLTLMNIIKMLLKETSKDYTLIHHHIFLISTQEHHIPTTEKLKLS
uniref:POC1 centriolar protein B n=1 Tax=Catagonus wagneri TaxID=51154 RepID=A0A8C3WTS8_9CETA